MRDGGFLPLLVAGSLLHRLFDFFVVERIAGRIRHAPAVRDGRPAPFVEQVGEIRLATFGLGARAFEPDGAAVGHHQGAPRLAFGRALATGIGFGILGGKLLEATARQPEMANQLQVKTFIMAGLLDTAVRSALPFAILLGISGLISLVAKLLVRKVDSCSFGNRCSVNKK